MVNASTVMVRTSSLIRDGMRGKQVQRHREDQVRHQDEHADERRGPSGYSATSEAVSVAMSTIITAPGHNRRSIGRGPIWHN